MPAPTSSLHQLALRRRVLLAADWLSQAHETPEDVRAEWWAQGIALLPLGRRFDAIRMRAEIVHAAGGCPGPLGPVIHDPYSAQYYALVPPRTAESWDSPWVRCLGGGAWLGVPGIDRTEPPGLYWMTAPVTPGALCAPEAVRELTDRGYEQLTARS
ncbi:hypothetical protein [Streptomyces alboflavus]|uniref:hypothetical protein n=1 Tax=Streptomyces alboflavus TaxID=67267 RepID=UPI000691D144|nr:hypothetical protein [Streptomyces alboflavus]